MKAFVSRRFVLTCVASTLAVLPAITRGADTSAQDPQTKAEAIVTKGLDYLKTQQKPDFSWQGPSDPPGLSAIVLKAYVQNAKHGAEESFVDKGFDKLLAAQKPDGSIGDSLVNYNTAIAISALALSGDAEYKGQLAKALNFLRTLQWDDQIQGVSAEMKVDASNPNFGGFGYGGGKVKRADLSNTQTALDALHDAGLKPDDPAFQAALKFVTRCQNNSETNDQKWSGDDGGFIYTSGDGGHSAGGEYAAPDGRQLFRSYGAMTYAGLKSMMYAGLSKSDPRVKAAWKWIGENWTLDEHPGLAVADPNAKDSGLFYYYHTLARALRAYGEPIIVDSKGGKHDWRVELIAKLESLQQPDGSWVGKQRWMENKPVLATTCAVLALEEAEADLKDHPAK